MASKNVQTTPNGVRVLHSVLTTELDASPTT